MSIYPFSYHCPLSILDVVFEAMWLVKNHGWQAELTTSKRWMTSENMSLSTSWSPPQVSANWGNTSPTANLLLSLIHQSHIFHKHYLPVMVPGFGRRPGCWFSNSSCKPDVSRVMGHICKSTCNISNGLLHWVSCIWNPSSTTLIKKKSLGGKYSLRDCRSKTETTEVQWKYFSSIWVLGVLVLTLFQKLALLLHLHPFIKAEDACSFEMPSESYVAPRQLITSGQGQEPAVRKPHGAPQQLVFSSSIYWHQTVIFNSTQVGAKEFCWLRRAFDGSVISSASIGLLHELKASQTFGKPLVFSKWNTISCLLMLFLWKWLLRTKRKFCPQQFENRADSPSTILSLAFCF